MTKVVLFLIVNLAFGLFLLYKARKLKTLSGVILFNIAALILCLVSLSSFGVANLSSLKIASEPANQVVDLDFVQNKLTSDQKEAIQLAVSEGFSATGVPVISEKHAGYVIFLGEPETLSDSQLDAANFLLEKFDLVGVDITSYYDLMDIDQSYNSNSNRLGLLLLKPGKLDTPYSKGAEQLVLSRPDRHIVDVNQALAPNLNLAVVLSNEPLLKYKTHASPARLDPRDYRAADNVKKVIQKVSGTRVLLVIEKNVRSQSVAKLLMSQVPAGYALSAEEE